MAQDGDTGNLFVVKVSRVMDCQDHAMKLQRELEICSSLHHPNIVQCLGHEYVDQRLHIFLEFIPGGSLRRLLNEFGPFAAERAPLLRKATRGLLEGLSFLHTLSPPVVHRDLKGANVLVDRNFCLKLADFGCSKCEDLSQSFSAVGTVQWMAPEVITQTGGHGRKADIWSFGCVVIEMATAADPWGKNAFDNIMQAMHVIVREGSVPTIPDDLSASVYGLVRSCLQRDPQSRPCAVELLSKFLSDAAPEERSLLQ